jgi:hypothetical protein
MRIIELFASLTGPWKLAIATLAGLAFAVFVDRKARR